ncbi:MAG: hypothetical protein K8L99_09025 [Anaerolineae bacterium]|nr:hypothetical protein [Anaerolineae bacterium]
MNERKGNVINNRLCLDREQIKALFPQARRQAFLRALRQAHAEVEVKREVAI